MRGEDAKQEAMFSYLSPEKRGPAEHPAGLVVSHSTKRRVRLKAKSSLVLFAILLTSGCYVGPKARLYPVQGPLSAQTPVPVFVGKISGSYSGKISVVLGNGEVCKARWTSATAMPANSMSTIWDSVYGPGYYVAHIHYDNGQSVLPCDRGTVLHVQWIINVDDNIDVDNRRADVFVNGVAKDSDGNIYKVVF